MHRHELELTREQRSQSRQAPTDLDSALEYAPEFLRDGGSLDVPYDLAALAVRAIDRIMADDSEWRDLWQDAAGGDTNAAFDTVRGLRMVLSALREVA